MHFIIEKSIKQAYKSCAIRISTDRVRLIGSTKKKNREIELSYANFIDLKKTFSADRIKL